MHQLVLCCTTAQHLGVALGWPFDDDRLCASDSSPMFGQRGSFNNDSQSFKPIADYRRITELIDKFSGFGSLSRRKDEGVGRVVFGRSGDLKGLFEIRIGFTGITHDDVGGHRKVVNPVASGFEFLEVAIGGVPAMHQRENAVTTRLQRKMKVWANGRVRPHCGNRVLAQILGVWTRETHTIDPINLTDRRQEVSEEGASAPVLGPELSGDVDVIGSGSKRPSATRQIAPIGIDVLAQQGDFPNPIGGKSLDFREQFTEGPTDFTTANRRNDAVGTGVVTTNLNGDPR